MLIRLVTGLVVSCVLLLGSLAEAQVRDAEKLKIKMKSHRVKSGSPRLNQVVPERLFDAAIYGEDDRISPALSDDLRLRAIAENVVALTDFSGLPINDSFCSGAIFNKDGFRFLLTAAHCIEDQAVCDQTYVVRNYEKDANGQLRQDQIQHRCERVVFSNMALDIAIATITGPSDSTAPDIQGIPFVIGSTDPGEPLVLMGHPSGEDKKIAGNCQVHQKVDFEFNHHCDAFTGNSGGPIFNLNDYSLAGILIRGEDDFNFDGSLAFYSFGSSVYYEVASDLAQVGDEFEMVLAGDDVDMFSSASGQAHVLNMGGGALVSFEGQRRSLCDMRIDRIGQVQRLAPVMRDNLELSPDTLWAPSIVFGSRTNVTGGLLTGGQFIELKDCSSERQIERDLRARLAHVQIIGGFHRVINNIDLICNLSDQPERCGPILERAEEIIVENNYSYSNTGVGWIYVEEIADYSHSQYLDFSPDASSDEINTILSSRMTSSGPIEGSYFFIVNDITIKDLTGSNDENHPDFETAVLIRDILEANPEVNSSNLGVFTIYIEPNWYESTYLDVRLGATRAEIEDRLQDILPRRGYGHLMKSIRL